MSSFDVPILLLTFNREKKALTVLNAIRAVEPKKIYIASDGGRNDEERIKVKQIRKKLLASIDWDCEVIKLFHPQNQGCKNAVSSSITNFFKSEEKGIVLEDDCLPNIEFFSYCKNALELYEKDLNIYHISGTNILNKSKSSYLSKYPMVWGWATWKDRWEKYDKDLSNIESFKEVSYLLQSLQEKQYWKNIFQDSKKNKIDTWDYQWIFTIWKNKAMALAPELNMVKNIGFDLEATHTIHDPDLNQIQYSDVFKIPEKIKVNPAEDYAIFNMVYLKNKSTLYKLKQIIKYYIK